MGIRLFVSLIMLTIASVYVRADESPFDITRIRRLLNQEECRRAEAQPPPAPAPACECDFTTAFSDAEQINKNLPQALRGMGIDPDNQNAVAGFFRQLGVTSTTSGAQIPIRIPEGFRLTLKETNDNDEFIGGKGNAAATDFGRTHALSATVSRAYTNGQRSFQFDSALYTQPTGGSCPAGSKCVYSQIFAEVNQGIYSQNNIPLHIAGPIFFTETRVGGGVVDRNRGLPAMALSQQLALHNSIGAIGYTFKNEKSGGTTPFAVIGRSTGVIVPLFAAKGKCKIEGRGEVGANLVTYRSGSNVFVTLQADVGVLERQGRSVTDHLIDGYFRYQARGFANGNVGNERTVGGSVSLTRNMSAGTEVKWYGGRPEGPMNPFANSPASSNKTLSVFLMFTGMPKRP
jgi:hypothetical protein